MRASWCKVTQAGNVDGAHRGPGGGAAGTCSQKQQGEEGKGKLWDAPLPAPTSSALHSGLLQPGPAPSLASPSRGLLAMSPCPAAHPPKPLAFTFLSPCLCFLFLGGGGGVAPGW